MPGAAAAAKPTPKGFAYTQTNCHVQCTFEDGQWGPIRVVESPYFQMHIAATSIHYGQAVFEGLKAHKCKDGKVRIFRGDENGLRFNRSAERMAMATLPPGLFEVAVRLVVSKNIEYVPEYGTGGSLYIRPLLIGTGPDINLMPSNQYEFIVFVAPAGNFYEGGIKPVQAMIVEDHDRAAPRGMGSVKVAGNYGACYNTSIEAKQKGFPVTLYLDAATHSYIEEFTSSNFFAISADGKKYITPASESILPSITNKTLCALAQEMGLEVESRPVHVDELETFSEVGACGTAVVMTPVSRLVRGDKEYTFAGTANGLGPVQQKLYDRIRAIQHIIMAEEPSVTSFREYLRVKTVHPKPDYLGCVEFLRKEAKAADLECRVFECVPGKPIVLMTWPGTDPSLPSILLNSHTDVVPVEAEKWSHDPFEAVKTEDGKIYARGSQDMKCVGIQYLYAVRRLKDCGVRVKRTLHLSWVPDEEIGGQDGMRLFVETEDFKKLNVGFALDEGLASPSEKCAVFIGERAPTWLNIVAKGPPGHASRLLDDTAMEKLYKVICKCMKFRQEQRDLLDKGALLGEVTTLNVTILSGGTQHNVIPSEVKVGIDVRIPPTTTLQDFQKMAEGWLEQGTSIEWVVTTQTCKPTVADQSNPWWVAFYGACEAAGVQLDRPTIFPAATDSRFLRMLNLPVFGFSPMWNTPVLLHDHDEYLEEGQFLRGVDVYEKILPVLANLIC